MPAHASAAWERRLNTIVRWSLRHWLVFANGLVLLYGGVPWLAPLAFSAGYERLGQVLFLIYTPLCHQIPERSFFVNGYQVAFCHREAVMYTALFAGGLVFAALRAHIRPISLRAGGLLLLPMLIDGSSHMIDDVLGTMLRGGAGSDAAGTLNFWVRVLTGLLFALAVVLVVYPRLERDLRRAQALLPAG